jgi:TPR repeat protein
MRMLLMSLVLALGLASMATATAGPLEDARAAYQAGDYAEALRGYRLAAEEGDPWAQYMLGFMYQNRKGVPQDYAEAARWYRLAGEGGNLPAQVSLGFIYEAGEGVVQDYAEALRWYRLAAERGDSWAQYMLGLMYGNGKGVVQDYVLGHMWLNLAAAQGHFFAVENRDITAKNMTPAQIAEAQKLAREWVAAHPQ